MNTDSKENIRYKFEIESLGEEGYALLITLLDYQTPISECLKSIRLPSGIKLNLLIDTAICSGINEYRFVKTFANGDGRIDTGRYEYVSVGEGILEKANEMLRAHPEYLRNSVLPESEVLKILK